MTDRLQRIWAPHRLAYVTGEGGSAEDETCPFCRIPTLGDEEGLVVARSRAVYAVLNKHPYRHVAELEELTEEESHDLTDVTRRAVVAIKKASSPHGFNVGLNLGGVAGGSLADHLHQHVVPRWGGDANFITVLANTKVMPQLLAETRAVLAEAWPAA